jgi:hypothetical protein
VLPSTTSIAILSPGRKEEGKYGKGKDNAKAGQEIVESLS